MVFCPLRYWMSRFYFACVTERFDRWCYQMLFDVSWHFIRWYYEGVLRLFHNLWISVVCSTSDSFSLDSFLWVLLITLVGLAIFTESHTRYLSLTCRLFVGLQDESDEMLSRGFKDQIYDVYRYLPPDLQVGLRLSDLWVKFFLVSCLLLTVLLFWVESYNSNRDAKFVIIWCRRET